VLTPESFGSFVLNESLTVSQTKDPSRPGWPPAWRTNTAAMRRAARSTRINRDLIEEKRSCNQSGIFSRAT
jgi:hypothetical protein